MILDKKSFTIHRPEKPLAAQRSPLESTQIKRYNYTQITQITLIPTEIKRLTNSPDRVTVLRLRANQSISMQFQLECHKVEEAAIRRSKKNEAGDGD